MRVNCRSRGAHGPRNWLGYRLMSQFGSKAEVQRGPRNVRFWGKSRHHFRAAGCLLVMRWTAPIDRHLCAKMVVVINHEGRQRYWQGEREVMQDRSNTRDRENPSWLRSVELVLVVGTRSADRIRASGRRTAQTGRTHSCTRPTRITVKTTLAKPGPSTYSQKPTCPKLFESKQCKFEQVLWSRLRRYR